MEKSSASKPPSAPATVPTTTREVWAWWLYMVAIEPISVVVLQLFMPLLIEALPSQVGHLEGRPDVACTGAVHERCVLGVLGVELSGTTLSYGIISLSVALQAAVFICFGALADYGTMRRLILGVATFVGMLSCFAVLLVAGQSSTLIAAALSIMVTICFGVGLMIYNSYLPLLAENHPEKTTFQSDDPQEIAGRREVVSSSLSTKSFMLGYGASVLVLALCAVYIYLAGGDFWKLQQVIAFCGLWWGLGSIYPLCNLKARSGPSFPKDASYWTFSVKKTAQMIRKCNLLPHTFRYLLAYFLFADGCNTIAQVAVIFARSELNAPYSVLISCSLLAPFCSVLGNFFFFSLQKRLNIPTKSMLLLVLSLLVLLTVYCGSGVYFESFGMHHLWETYVVSCVYGFLIGAMLSFARVIYGEMIPAGEEAEFFALYAITDKGSSWMGPLLHAFVSGITGNQRYGLFVLGLMILLPFPLLIRGVDPVQARRDAIKFAAMAGRTRPQSEMAEKNLNSASVNNRLI